MGLELVRCILGTADSPDPTLYDWGKWEDDLSAAEDFLARDMFAGTGAETEDAVEEEGK
jgi:hypothetical protein